MRGAPEQSDWSHRAAIVLSRTSPVVHGARCDALERTARAAFDTRVGRLLTDAEWEAARCRLLEFAGILRGWDRKAIASRRGNVEVPCQQEP